jgi:hypothetical protein
MKTNTSLSAFTGGVTETKGVISAELTIGSKTHHSILRGRRWWEVQPVTWEGLDSCEWVCPVHAPPMLNAICR